MKKEIFIYGGGGHGKVVIETIESQFGAEAVAGIFDDDPQKKDKDFYGHRIIGSIFDFKRDIPQLILAIGDNATRANKAGQITGLVKNFLTVIAPETRISRSAKINEGTLLMPGVIINADASIGVHCIINTHATIEHDCVVGDFSHIAPGAVLTGAVQIGKATLVGANATIVPGIKIGNNCLIAAGSVVTSNIPDNALVRGNPAKIVKIKKR